MTHPWTEMLDDWPAATRASLALAFQAEFDCTMEEMAPEHLNAGWRFVQWYLDAHRDLPPGNGYVTSTGRALDPRPYLGEGAADG